MANTKVTQHVIANNAITADQLASAAVTDAKLHSTLDLSGKTLTLPATAIPSASTATTQASSDNSTKLATTAYVTTAIGNLVDSAPTALDTLNELAAALGDDANFSGTVTTSLASKLPLAGGTMTGNIVLSGAPTSGLHPATKTYTDTADALKLNLSGGTLTGDLILNTTTALKLPVGTTGQRPTAATGQIRYNSTDGALEVYNGTAWTAVGTGSSNKVLDTFTGDGSNATFTLSVTPANEDAIMVFIDGAYQEKSDYVLTNNSLVLDTAPLLNEKIAVHITTASVHDGTTAVNQQFTATAGQTDFTLSQDPKSENNTQVYINGVYQQKTDYTVTGTTLAFDTGLTVGDVVEVNMFTVATLGNTDTVNEGVSNLYHTTARARGAISVSGNAISYNSSTGVLSANFEEGPVFTSNVGIGVTPDTLSSGYSSLQINGYAYLIGHSGGDHYITNNAYHNSGWKYGQTSTAQKIQLASGKISLMTAASGSADSAITWNTGLVQDSAGKVGIGTSSPAKLLHLSEASDGTKLRMTRGGVCEWDFSIGNTSTLTGVGSGALELLPQNAGTANEFAIGTAGSTAPLFHVTNSQNYFAKKVGIGTTNPASKLHLESGNAHNKLSITSTASGGTGYDAIIDLLGSASNSETAINMGINGDADREQIKAYQSYLSLRTNNVERISYQPTQGSVYENIHENFTQGNLNLSLLRGMRFARAGSIADDTKIKLFQGSYTYSGGTIDYVITDGGGSQNHVGSGTINWYSREATCHFTLTGTNVSNKIVVNADTSNGTYADGKFTIAIRATNGDSHITIMNRLGSTIYIGLKISVNYVG